MTETEPTADEIVDAIHAFANQQMDSGVSDGDIQAVLVERGLDQQSAAAVILNLKQVRSADRQAAGNRNIIFGVILCVGGYFVRTMATSEVVWLLATIAMLIGALSGFRGVWQSKL